VLLVVFALTPNARVKADDDDNDHGSPVGTWILKATLDTPPGSPPFVVTNLVAINPGGTFTITDNVFNAHTSGNPFLPPPFVVDNGDGYGSWERRGSNQFATTFKRFLFAGAKTDSAIYGPFFVGQHVGEGTIQGLNTLQVGKDGDTWGGPFTFQARNLRGDVVAAGSGTVSATRLKIEPLAH
jgi:hypothetical protein